MSADFIFPRACKLICEKLLIQPVISAHTRIRTKLVILGLAIFQSHPQCYSEKGVSIVFVNTDKGMQLFEQMRKFAQVIPASIQEGVVKQGNLRHPIMKSSARDFFMRILTQKIISGMGALKERLKAAIFLRRYYAL